MNHKQNKLEVLLAEKERRAVEKVNDNYIVGKLDGYSSPTSSDGYSYEQQISIRLTNDDILAIKEINDFFFEGELTNSTIGRVLIRKGVQWYKKLSS